MPGWMGWIDVVRNGMNCAAKADGWVSSQTIAAPSAAPPLRARKKRDVIGRQRIEGRGRWLMGNADGELLRELKAGGDGRRSVARIEGRGPRKAPMSIAEPSASAGGDG